MRRPAYIAAGLGLGIALALGAPAAAPRAAYAADASLTQALGDASDRGDLAVNRSVKVLINLNGPNASAQNNVLVEDAEVQVIDPATGEAKGEPVYTDAQGVANLSQLSPTDVVRVSYDSGSQDYVSQCFRVCELANNGAEIILQRKLSTAPTIGYAGFSKIEDDKTAETGSYSDILQYDAVIKPKEQEYDTLGIRAVIDWGDAGEGKVELVAGSDSTELTHFTAVKGEDDVYYWAGKLEGWDLDQDFKIVATDGAGHRSERLLKLTSETRGILNKLIDGTGISYPYGAFVTVPSSIPILGGVTAGVPKLSTFMPCDVSIADGKITVMVGITPIYTEKKEGKKWEPTSFKKAWNEGSALFDKSELDEDLKTFKELKNLLKTNGLADALDQMSNFNYTIRADLTVFGFLEFPYDEWGNFSSPNGGIILDPSASLVINCPIGSGFYFTGGLSGEAFFKMRLKQLFTTVEDRYGVEPTLEGSLPVDMNLGVGFGLPNVICAEGGATGGISGNVKIGTGKTSGVSGSIDGSYGWYTKVTVVVFSAKWGGNFWEGELAKFGGDNSTQSLSADLASGAQLAAAGYDVTWDDGSSASDDPYNLDSYQEEDLSYLETGSENPAAEDGPMLRSAGTGVTASDIGHAGEALRTNIYRNANVEYTDLGGGRRLATWTDVPSGEAKDSQNIHLMYAVYDGGAWSAPAQVATEDSTYDGQFSVAADGKGGAYLAWQSAQGLVNKESLTNADNARNLYTLSVAHFDGSKMSDVTTVDNKVGDTSELMLSPQVSANGDAAYLTWVGNDGGDIFGRKGTNTLRFGKLSLDEGGKPVFKAADKTYAAAGPVTEVATDVSDSGALQLAYVDDTDGSLESGDEDRVLYQTADAYKTAPAEVDRGEAAQTAGEESGVVESGAIPQSSSAKPVGGPKYFEHQLYYVKGGSVMQQGWTISDDSEGVVSGDTYDLAKIAGRTCVIAQQNDGVDSTLHAYYLTRDDQGRCAWNGGVDLVAQATGDGSQDGAAGYAVTDFATVVDADGTIHALANVNALTDTLENLNKRAAEAKKAGKSDDEISQMYKDFDPYGESCLRVLDIAASIKADADADTMTEEAPSFDASEYAPGNGIEISIPVTNTGTISATGSKPDDPSLPYQTFEAEVWAPDGSGATGMLDTTLMPGESGTITAFLPLDYDLPATQTVTVTLKHTTKTAAGETTEGLRTYKLQLGSANMAVENMTASRNAKGDVVVSADVVNRGTVRANGVQAKLMRAARDGETPTLAADDKNNPTGVALVEVEPAAAVGDGAFDALGSSSVSYTVKAADVKDSDVFYVLLDGYTFVDQNGTEVAAADASANITADGGDVPLKRSVADSYASTRAPSDSAKLAETDPDKPDDPVNPDTPSDPGSGGGSGTGGASGKSGKSGKAGSGGTLPDTGDHNPITWLLGLFRG